MKAIRLFNARIQETWIACLLFWCAIIFYSAYPSAKAVVIHQGDEPSQWTAQTLRKLSGVFLFTKEVPEYFSEYIRRVEKTYIGKAGRARDGVQRSIERRLRSSGARLSCRDDCEYFLRVQQMEARRRWLNIAFLGYPSFKRLHIVHQDGSIPFVPIDSFPKELVQPLWPIPLPEVVYNKELQNLVVETAEGGMIILSISDETYLSMTENFVATSILPYNFTNHLIVGLSKGFCTSLASVTKNCFEFPRELAGGNFGTAEFASLVNVKTEAMLSILLMGYDVLLSDVDIVFLKNPLTDMLSSRYKEYDLLIQDDLHSPNSGFIFVRATRIGVTFAGEALRLSNYGTSAATKRQQTAVEAAIKNMKRSALQLKVCDVRSEKLCAIVRDWALEIQLLPKQEYPVGLTYFANTRRLFAGQNPCARCIIVHNNFIVGRDAKIHRFREHLMWEIDSPPGYYTDRNQKFIEYGNPDPSIRIQEELRNLQVALKLGEILGRSVILPRFRCHHCDLDIRGECTALSTKDDACPLNALLSVRSFFKFHGNARENMFRYNRLVPLSVRLEHNVSYYEHSTSPRYLLLAKSRTNSQSSGVGRNLNSTVPYYGNLFGDEYDIPASEAIVELPGETISDAEVKSLFGHIDNPVIRFHWLYGVDVVFTNSSHNAYWQEKIARSFKRMDFRQFNEMGTK